MSSVARAGKPKASGTKAQDGGKGGHRTSTSPMGPRAAAQAPPGLQQYGLKLLNKDAESAKASRWRFVSAQDEMHQAGTRVRAVLRDGTEFEGKFFTGDTDSARVAIYVQTVLKRGEADQAQDIEEETIVMLDDTALVSFQTLGPVKDLRGGDGPGSSGAGGKFETDVDISHKRSLSAGRPGAERTLERVDDSWLLGGEAQENGGGRKTVSGALTGSAGSWDQFKANERFGVKADFNEELYTTPKPKMSAEREAEAARLAREIEGETAKNVHVAEERGQHIANDLDEEDRFSGVMRGGEQRNSGPRGDARGGKRGGGGGKAPSANMPEPELAVRLLPSGRDGMYVPPARRQQQVTSPTEAASSRADRDFESQPPQQQPVVLPPAAPTSPKRPDKAALQPPSSIPATPSEHIDAPKATPAPPAATPVKPHTDEKANKSSEASTATTTPASSRSSTPSFRKSLNVHAKEFVPGGVKAPTAPTPPVMTPPQPPHQPPAHPPPHHHHQPPPQQTPPPHPPPQQQSPQQQQQQPPHQPGGMPQPQMYPQQHRPPYYYPQQPGQFVPQYGMGPPRGQGGGYDSMPPPGTVPVAAYMQQPQGRGPIGPGSPYPPGAIPMGQGPGIPGVYPQQYENPQMSGQMVMPPGQYLMQPYGNVARGYGSPVPGQMMGRGQAGQFPRGPQGQQYMGPPQAGQPVRGHYGMEQGYIGPDGQPGPLDMGGYPDSPQHMGGPGTPGLMPKDNEALSPAHMPMPPPHGHSPHGPPQYGPQAYMSRDAARGRGQRTPKADRGSRGKMLGRGGRMGGMGRGHTGSPIPQGAGMPPHHVASPQHGSIPSPMGPLPGPPLPAPPDMHPSPLPPPQAPPLGDQA